MKVFQVLTILNNVGECFKRKRSFVIVRFRDKYWAIRVVEKRRHFGRECSNHFVSRCADNIRGGFKTITCIKVECLVLQCLFTTNSSNCVSCERGPDGTIGIGLFLSVLRLHQTFVLRRSQCFHCVLERA